MKTPAVMPMYSEINQLVVSANRRSTPNKVRLKIRSMQTERVVISYKPERCKNENIW
jgi:hypothetical protein